MQTGVLRPGYAQHCVPPRQALHGQLVQPVGTTTSRHWPAQICVPEHAFPQSPQLPGSRRRSTHAPLQLVVPRGQSPGTQTPAAHRPAQTWSGAPQFIGSVVRSMHVPPTSV